MPELSVVIPTLNRGRLFHDTVRQVLGQRFADFDLWLIDQSDPDQRAANEAARMLKWASTNWRVTGAILARRSRSDVSRARPLGVAGSLRFVACGHCNG